MAAPSFQWGNWWDKKAKEKQKELEEKAKALEDKVAKLEAQLTPTYTTITWPTHKQFTVTDEYTYKTVAASNDVWGTVDPGGTFIVNAHKKICKCGHNDYNHNHRTDACYHEEVTYDDIFSSNATFKVKRCKCQEFREKPTYRELPKGLI